MSLRRNPGPCQKPARFVKDYSSKEHHVAVASAFGFHFDVYMSFVWYLAHAMNSSSSGGKIEVCAGTPFRYDFQTIIEDIKLYPYATGYREPEDLLPLLCAVR